MNELQINYTLGVPQNGGTPLVHVQNGGAWGSAFHPKPSSIKPVFRGPEQTGLRSFLLGSGPRVLALGLRV